ncbi:response regulator [Pseudomonas sp. ABC1]|nr:response regulator [Pseudomonas sp. ABC1]
MKNSLYLGVTLALLLVMVLYDNERHTRLLGWLAMVVAGRLLCVGYARWALRRGVEQDNALRLIVHMGVIKAFEGLAWGLLAWIAMGQASLPEQLLVMASLAGVGSNAVSLLAPVFPLYFSMQSMLLLTINSKLWVIGDPTFRMLALGCALYVAGQVGQALLAQRASRRSIALRFENLELVERLRGVSEQAEQARIKAEEANLAKSKFLAAASHDLRQPVHAQELFLEVLARSDLSDDQHKVLNNARVASQASAEMLNTLLDFSRIEAGVITPRRCVFQLQPLLNKLANELGGLADAKGIVYRSRETHLAVNSDPALLERILRNLITNAIRYTETGGLLVACRKRGERVSIEVIDTGIGIDARQQREIFREFHQLGNPERDRLKGLGLGLAITDGLVRSLGHGLSLVSEPGRGSIFRVLLPLARSDFSEDVRDLMGGPALPSGLLQGLRVLVIEDDASLRMGMLQLLAEWGCDCRTVEGLDEALAEVGEWSVQLLVSDYRLREHLTGAEVIARAREAAGRELPALIITGDTAPERLREAHDSGVPLLHKPVSPAQLYRTMVDLSGVRQDRYAHVESCP